MSGYTLFSKYYDELTQNISYKKRAGYFNSLIKRERVSGKRLVDLACGTGSLSLELERLGYSVTGAEASADMLAVAASKNALDGSNVFYINQSMQELRLATPVDIVICALDSINHLTEPKLVLKTFKRVSRCLAPDGVFIFDVNSEYKHYSLLSGKTYVYDCENIYCVWQNGESKNDTIKIELDFFERAGSVYKREYESFCERWYSHDAIKEMLFEAGLEITGVFADDTFDAPGDSSQRIIYAAKKHKR